MIEVFMCIAFYTDPVQAMFENISSSGFLHHTVAVEEKCIQWAHQVF